ncbi:hypothetical protein LEMLEM_LOCUS24167 [Lemmus lemmus]
MGQMGLSCRKAGTQKQDSPLNPWRTTHWTFWMWWHMPAVLPHAKPRQGNPEFQGSLGYRTGDLPICRSGVSSSAARAPTHSGLYRVQSGQVCGCQRLTSKHQL